ncbi:MAG: glycosyltransferase [Clostridiales bacterium]|nr:glycosyltransferase [Candidatus Equinaster intestinalis]
MKVLLINAVCGILSTGRICIDIAQQFEKEGNEVKIAYGRASVPDKYKKYAVRIGNKIDVCWHAFMSKVFDQRGYWSRIATKRFLRWADKYNPDILWLHNIHDYYINIEMLFKWIKSRPDMTVKWTQHDCWAFTGGCMHFLMSGCSQWQQQCEKCINKRKILPLCSNENYTFNLKKRCFTGIKNMTLITPSQWLANLIKISYLKDYDVKVVNNKIDKEVFKPTLGDFRGKYGIGEKNIILGVASLWDKSKGLYDFYKLAQVLDTNSVIVIVGLSKKQLKSIPKGIIGIGRTNNATELAQIYTTADVFFNPTYQDNYPTVNLEAEACGTKVITYDTGGCKETIRREDSKVIEVGNWKRVLSLLK